VPTRRPATPRARRARADARGRWAALALAGALGLGATAPRPACREVAPAEDLAGLLAAARPGEAFCLAPGVHRGPLVLDGTTLEGPRDAIVRSSGQGTTVRLRGAGAALRGVTVQGSGGRFDTLDAAVHVEGRGPSVEGVAVRGATFGILVERATEARIRGNEVLGDGEAPLGLRGDGIRLWEVYDSRVEENRVLDGRDVVLWYASRNRLVGNRVERGRYGAHLMYSHGNEIAGNRFVGNVTGLFVMYSRDVDVRDNVFADSGGAAGIGLGLKESGELDVRGNLFVHNTVGLYVDLSPLWPDDRNRFEGNAFRLNDVAVSFLGRAAGNAFRGNGFRDSRVQVAVAGGGDARAAEWRGNEFDDYAGYDLDGDGVGDVPYELRSLTSDLVAARPALAFFRGTPALALAETIGRIVPLFEPRLLLVDPAPRLARVRVEAGDAH
jgi:nitrous oxidase accessory protein